MDHVCKFYHVVRSRDRVTAHCFFFVCVISIILCVHIDDLMEGSSCSKVTSLTSCCVVLCGFSNVWPNNQDPISQLAENYSLIECLIAVIEL